VPGWCQSLPRGSDPPLARFEPALSTVRRWRSSVVQSLWAGRSSVAAGVLLGCS
jgi:hypothetical protein